MMPQSAMALEPTDSVPQPGQPAREFVRLVRDALIHLYDPAHLLRHPLHSFVAPALPAFGDAAQNLRNLLIDAIESLAPPDRRNPAEKEHRPYLTLVQRYVGGFPPEQIAKNLHIGPRQFSRELKKGVIALSAYLWDRTHDSQGPSPRNADASGADLHGEIEVLGVQLEPFTLAELVASIRPAAEALAKDYGAGFAAQERHDIHCLGDRTLARQALLSCLSALFSRSPRFVEVAPLRAQGLPGLQVTVAPTTALDDLQGIDLELATSRSLMAEQGGSVRVLRDESGGCRGLRLFFQPTEGAHVLVVDDNARMLHLYGRYLASGRYRVTAAASAAEAQALLAKSAPDAIVVDVMMREVDGWQLLQWVRSQPRLRTVPVLVCSVLDEPKLAFSLGAQAYLKKPVAAGDLLQALARLLDERSQVEPSPAGP